MSTLAAAPDDIPGVNLTQPGTDGNAGTDTEESSVPDDATSRAESETKIAEALKEHRAESTAARSRPDCIRDYRIHLDQEIDTLTKRGAGAYQVTGAHNGQSLGLLAAYLTDVHLPVRLGLLRQLHNVEVPILPVIHAHGVAYFNALESYRYSIICEQPHGIPLKALIETNGAITGQRFLCDHLIRPLLGMIEALDAQGANHGTLNLDTIHLRESGQNRLNVTECFSEPAGYSQPHRYEALEVALCDPVSKAQGGSSGDYYALGVIITELMFGQPIAQNANREEWIRYRLERGSYDAIVGKRRVPHVMQDLLRGLLHDGLKDRWGCDEVEQWLSGKQFNLVLPSVARESTRPFELNGRDVFNTRALAYYLFRNWEGAAKHIRNGSVTKWLEMSVSKPELAHLITQLVDDTGGTRNQVAKYDDELISRVLIALDSDGVLRYHSIACSLYGLGSILSHAILSDDAERRQHIYAMLSLDLASYLGDIQGGFRDRGAGNVVWQLQRTRTTLNSTDLGFGVERCLYDLNPAMPCQSPLVKDDYVLEVEDLLKLLDSKAAEYYHQQDPVDVHTAAFISNRLEYQVEIKVPRKAGLANLQNMPLLKKLALLIRAQQKIPSLRLKGLALWVRYHLEELVTQLHSRSIRHDMRAALDEAAESGELSRLMDVLCHPHYIPRDAAGLQHARQRFAHNIKVLEALKDTNVSRRMAHDMGLRIAASLAFVVFALSLVLRLQG